MIADLLVIDPQNSFVATETNPYGLKKGSLLVPGGQDDMDRLASLLGDIRRHIRKVRFTKDQHHKIDISHPGLYADDNGVPPPGITTLTYDEARDTLVGVLPPWEGGGTRDYRVRKLGNIPVEMARPIFGRDKVSFHQYVCWYVKRLTETGRYPHVIWPEHCMIGTPGADIYPSLMEAAQLWADEKIATIDFVVKGDNPFTEHFSAIKAEVPLPNDPSTQVRTTFIRTLEEADVILLAGEALSHCVANTGRDIVAEFSNPAYVKKIILLRDACSNVPGFDGLGDKFVQDMSNLGMQVMTCAEARRLFR